MDELDRLYRRLVSNIRANAPELLTRSFEVAEIYQQIVPYRTNRRELGFDSNDEYELALMQLVAGLRGYLSGDAEMQKAMRGELASSNPDLSAFRLYATSTIALSADALRSASLAVQSPALRFADDDDFVAPQPSPAEQVSIAARATETVETGGGVGGLTTGATHTEERADEAERIDHAAPVTAVATPPDGHRSFAHAAAEPEAPLVASRVLRFAPAPAGEPVAPPAVRCDHADDCRYCGGVLPDGRKVVYCPRCGHNLTVQHCPACGTELEMGWKFCITCGRDVS